ERLTTVVSRIVEIDGMNQSVAAATEEQTTVVEALNMDIHQINVPNQQSVANLNATLADCDALSHQASRLKQLVDRFRIRAERGRATGMIEHSLPASRLPASAQSMTLASQPPIHQGASPRVTA